MLIIAAALNGSRDRILVWVQTEVERTETEISEILDRLTHGFHDKLTFVGELEACLYTAISQETLNIELSPSDPAAERPVHSVTLADRMDQARNLIEAEQKELDVLWNSWTQTQWELACLSIEVLGAKSIALPAMPQPAPQFTAAIKAHDQNQHQLDQSMQRKRELQTQIKSLRTKTQANLNAQQKVGASIQSRNACANPAAGVAIEQEKTLG